MAIYHCSIKTFSRAKGQTATAAIAYRAGIAIQDEQTGLAFNYTKRKGVDCSAVVLPAGAPEWAKNPSALWNAAEKSETRKNSTVAREFEISLPHELSKVQRQELAEAISRKLVDRFGFAIQYSIHKPGEEDGKNHHVHILATTRKMEASGLTNKTRELDEVAKEKDQETGQRFNPAVFEVRQMVADTINQHLKKAGIKEVVSHKSLIDQQADAIKIGDFVKAAELHRQPTIHVGKNPKTQSFRIQANQQIHANNNAKLSKLIGSLENAIIVQNAKPSAAHGQRASSGNLKPAKAADQDFSAAPVTSISGSGGGVSIEGILSNIASLERQLSSLPNSFLPNIAGRRMQLAEQISALKRQLAESQDKTRFPAMPTSQKTPQTSPRPPMLTYKPPQ